MATDFILMWNGDHLVADLWAKNWVPYVIQIQLKQGYNDFEYYKNVIKSLIFFGNRTFTTNVTLNSKVFVFYKLSPKSEYLTLYDKFLVCITIITLKTH